MASTAARTEGNSTSKPRVEGTVTEDGAVLCKCGKKCGQALDGAVEFTCRCGNRVSVDSHIMFLRTCDKAIDRIHNIINLMASKQKSIA